MITEQQIEHLHFQVYSDCALREVNHITYVWSESKQGYYNLGEIGNFIWTYCQYPITKDQIVRVLMEEYVVSLEECKENVEILLMELVEDNLLKLIDLEGFFK
ncbi:PqqD family peptide modification chaperone [Niallia sp. Sow4_A1]|uniref:PqqD family peptide modification chaperone n=1 Tax=Niallia sp. Sow4_A1 TaxID=3438793 RepID=UPI003F99DD98